VKVPARARIGLALFAAAAAWGALPAAGAAAEEEAVLFAAGDTMLARWMHREAFGGTAKKMFGSVLERIRGADLAFVNLECVLSDRGAIVEKGERKPFPYRGRPGMVRFLKEAGVDVVSQANNHAGDYGPKALLDSLAILRSQGIVPLGAGKNADEARRIRYTRAGGAVVAWIAWDTQENTFAARPELAGTFYLAEPEALEALGPLIREARRFADVVILTPHWGPNWAAAPTPERRRLARSLIRAGADAILGHSSHVVQGMEVYRNRPILYDMGSLLFDSVSDPRIRDSLFFEIRLSKEGIREITARPVALGWRSVDAAPPGRRERTVEKFAEASLALDPKFRHVLRYDRVVVTFPPDRPSFWRRFRPAGERPKEAPPIEKPEASFDFARTPPSVLRAPPPRIDRTGEAEFSNGVRFLGMQSLRPIPNTVSLLMRLYFTASEAVPPPPCEIGIALKPARKPGAAALAAATHEPGDWSRPTTAWKPGEVVEDTYLFRMPDKLPPGGYDVFLSVQAVPAEGAAVPVPLKGSSETEVRVGKVRVEEGAGRERVRGLLGYEIQRLEAPRRVSLKEG
jgi:poly-gamma-glutamate capsule biosynthesis protein CapA/YwtB (metallophosphatase superfamily)